MAVILSPVTETLPAPDINTDDILRYAGCRRGTDDNNILKLLSEVISESKSLFTYKVCYVTGDITVTEDEVHMGKEIFASRALAKNLKGCSKAILFGATTGIAVDRLIMRYSRISPAKAVLLQGFGAERIEALCDIFCKKKEKEYPKYTFAPRFSPGYGDLDITNQKKIFQMLNCEKNIGLFLNESMLMSPTKSVTAFAGISI